MKAEEITFIPFYKVFGADATQGERNIKNR